ncbi:MAG: hypothetical protein FJ078_09700 [Cyanobacteria bacterium K_DeepCast_35m_m2_155]|nr:hypothetical protein [Cyanobacteria bacterium K_DeepCast_35m_m2_155]
MSQTIPCPSCGGSGMLRLGDQSFRTCLDCLGQGQIPGFEPATTTGVVLTEARTQLRAEPCIKDASASAAR